VKKYGAFAVLLALGLVLPVSCRMDECDDSYTGCDGDRVLSCEFAWSDGDAPRVRASRPCDNGMHCALPPGGHAFCALEFESDPQCAAVEESHDADGGPPERDIYFSMQGYCEDSHTIMTCAQTFRTGAAPCPNDSTCESRGGWAWCPYPPPPPDVVCGGENCSQFLASLRLNGCCTAEGRCGGDLSAYKDMLHSSSDQLCIELHQAGEIDPTCPTGCVANGFGSFPGCRRTDGSCGIQADTVGGLFAIGLGCVDALDLGITDVPRSCPPARRLDDGGTG
jgi:hypothetical protein